MRYLEICTINGITEVEKSDVEYTIMDCLSLDDFDDLCYILDHIPLDSVEYIRVSEEVFDKLEKMYGVNKNENTLLYRILSNERRGIKSNKFSKRLDTKR